MARYSAILPRRYGNWLQVGQLPWDSVGLCIVAGNFGNSLVAAPATIASEIEPTTEQKTALQ